MTEYQDLQEAFRKYGEIHRAEKWNEERFYKDGYLKYEFSPEQVFLIAKSVEILKFFVDNSFFFKCDKEFLKSKSVDLFYLYQIIYTQYVHYVPKNMQSRIEKDNDFRNYEKSRITEGERDFKTYKKKFIIAQNQSFVQKGIGLNIKIPGSAIPFKS